MMQYVFYVSNAERKRQFATETAVYYDGERKKTVKKALHQEGAEHISHISSAYSRLSAIKPLSQKVDIARITSSDADSVTFDFIEGKGAERQLAEYLVAGDEKKMLELLGKIESIIAVLPSSRINPAKNPGFVEAFGETYDYSQECSSVGLVDINLDNFIIDPKGRWHLFDYEWCFDFAVPKQLLMQRVLFWFFIMRYKQLSLIRGNVFELVEIGDDIFIPQFIYNRYKKYFQSMHELIEAEWQFQTYVHANTRSASDTPNVKFGIKLNKQAVTAQKRAEKSLNEKNVVRQYEAISKAHAELIDEYHKVSRELSDIKSSRLYKYSSRVMKRIRGTS